MDFVNVLYLSNGLKIKDIKRSTLKLIPGGICRCHKEYYGTYCETSSTASSALCAYYEPCVQCLLDRREGNTCNDLDQRCSSGNTSTDVRPFHFEYFNDISDASIQCLLRVTTKDGSKCDHRFTYVIDPQQQTTMLKILDNRCTPVNFAGITMAIVAATFLIGCLMIVLLKVHNVIQDKREFAKFDEERKNMTTYNYESPIYNSPIRKYDIPSAIKNEEMEMNSL